MKKTLTILITLSLLVIGCSRKESKPYSEDLLTLEQYAKDDSLIYGNLECYKLFDHDAQDSALHALLYMEDCLRYDVNFRGDSIINLAIRNFKANGDNNRLARCYVAKAINFIHQNDYTQALQHVMQAKEINTDDAWTNYRINNVLAQINHHTGNYKHAINDAAKAMIAAKKINTSRLMAENLIITADCYDKLEEQDSFMVTIRRLENYKKQDDKYVNIAIANMLGNFYLKHNELDKAEEVLGDVYMFDISKKAALLLGNVLQKKGLHQQALDKWKDAMTSPEYTVVIPACEAVLRMEPDNSTAKDFMISSYKSIPQLKNGELISSMQSDYEQAQKESANYRKAIILLSIIVVLLLCFIVFYIYHRATMKAVRRRISTINQRYYLDIEDLNKAQKEVERLQKKIADYQEDKSRPEEWNMQSDILNAEPVLHLHRMAARGSEATAEHWKEISDLLLEKDTAFINEIARHEEINQKEQSLCMLVRLRFIPSEISALLGISSQNVTNMRGRLLQKMYGKKGGAREFDATIREL